MPAAGGEVGDVDGLVPVSGAVSHLQAAAGRAFAVTRSDDRWHVLEAAGVDGPREIGSVRAPQVIQTVAATATRAIVLSDSLWVMDFAEPADIRAVAGARLPSRPIPTAVHARLCGRHVLVAGAFEDGVGMMSFNVEMSDPPHVELRERVVMSPARGLACRGDRAIVSTFEGPVVIELGDDGSLTRRELIGSLKGTVLQSLALHGDVLFAVQIGTLSSNPRERVVGLRALDVRDPLRPQPFMPPLPTVTGAITLLPDGSVASPMGLDGVLIVALP
jgi:hypothetical protein